MPRLKSYKLVDAKEISVVRANQYFTVFLDLSSWGEVFVASGKGAGVLATFIKKLKCLQFHIESVSIIMFPAFISFVTDNVSRATIVFGYLFVIKIFNDKLAMLRQKLQRKDEDINNNLEDNRSLLMKIKENSRIGRVEQKRFEVALALKKSSATVYHLKEGQGIFRYQEG